MLDPIIRGISHLLLPVFALGMAGATIVVVITFCHDLVDFFEEDEPTPISGSSVTRK